MLQKASLEFSPSVQYFPTDSKPFLLISFLKITPPFPFYHKRVREILRLPTVAFHFHFFLYLRPMNFSSKLVEKAVEAFASLPGIGRKSALRLALHLIKQDKSFTEQFALNILHMRQNVQNCTICHNLSDDPVCQICADARRDRSTICVVESIRDIMAIEETSQFKGLYHVLGGVIAPIEGIGPEELQIESLISRVATGQIREIIMAISPTIEGDTTIFYLAKKLQPFPIQISSIARGVAFGGELEYADELTLGRSIAARTPYNQK